MKRLLLLLSVGALFTAVPAHAQYVFVDVNADGVCDANDILNDTITSVDIWFDTNHDAAGNTVMCTTDNLTALNMFSYEFVLHTRGDLTFGAFTNAISAFNVHFTLVGSSATDFHDGWAGTITDVIMGKFKVGSLAITVAPGTHPMLYPSSTSLIDANYVTAFGSECMDADAGNSIALGRDFGSSCGAGAPTSARTTTWGAIKNLYR